MNCEELQEYLPDFLDKSLSFEHVQEIKEHLTKCATCSDELASLAACQTLLSSLPAVDPPANFTARVMAEIRETARPPSFWERLFFPLQMKIPLQATALVLIAVLAAYLHQKEPPQQESMVAIRPEPFVAKRDETDKTARSVPQTPKASSRTPNAAKEATRDPLQQEFIDAAQSKEAKVFPKPLKQEKSAESHARGPATNLAQEQVRPPAMLTPAPKSSTSPRLEKSSPPGPAQAKEALAPVPQTETASALKGAPGVEPSLVSPNPRERNVAGTLDSPSSGPVIAADYELTIRLKPARDGQATAHGFESDPSQVEGRTSRLQQEIKTLDQARQRATETGEPRTVWLTIPRNQYDLLKKTLAGLGYIEMESPTIARENDTVAKSSDPLRMKVTILPSLPAENPLPSKPLNR